MHCDQFQETLVAPLWHFSIFASEKIRYACRYYGIYPIFWYHNYL